MLTKKQIAEIKSHLEKAQNPLFLFDNDPDGLCSFLLLRKFIERGKGFPVKTTPMNKEYMRKVLELEADYLFILDIPTVKQEFFDEIEKTNTPVVWIDHHENNYKEIPKFVNYFNPLTNKKPTSECVTNLCYQITQRKEDIWLAVAGEISDKDSQEYKEFQKLFPELSIKSENVDDIYYKSDIGKISQLLSYGLKDKTTNVIKMLKYLMNAKSPHDVLEENPKNREMHERFKFINKKLKKFVSKAKLNEKENKNKKIIFFEYAGDTSMSAEIANYLQYLFPKKLIFVIYDKQAMVNISGRGRGVKKILLESIKDLENATGGGHESAVGSRIMKTDLPKFKENILKNLE